MAETIIHFSSNRIAALDANTVKKSTGELQ